MAASMLHQNIGLVLLTVTHFTSGLLLSDYKICGDAECESRMSRVQAVEDHYSKDCRFLSFRQGEIIFVYQKLTGKREDLWAGTIDRRFGYFPKAAVKEEEIYATAQKVLETQQSDFFCIDENGYPVDITEQDDLAVSTGKIILPVITETLPSTPQSPSEKSHDKSVNTKTKSGQEDKVETLNEHSESPSWLRSSVTGLWGFVKKDDSNNIPKEDTTEEMDESSLTSSVTGWLGFGAKRNGESSDEPETQETSGNPDSVMTGWLNFGREVKEQDKTKSIQVDNPGEVFRSRKIALDFENNQFNQEENKETGTLGWLGNGISSTLGFGSNNKDSTGEGRSEETEDELEPKSSSWFDVGITDMLGFRKEEEAKEKDNRIEDSLVSAQNTDRLSNVPPPEQLKQPEVMDEKIVPIETKTNLNTDIKESKYDYHNETETINDQRPEHVEIELHTVDANSKEDGSQIGSQNDGFKDSKEPDEDTTISSDIETTYDSQVTYDLPLECNVTEANTDLLTENVADSQMDVLKFEIPQRELYSFQVEELDNSKVSETDHLQLNTGQEVQDNLGDKENHKEMASTIKVVNNIQDVFNDKLDMSEELIEMKQDVVEIEEPHNELEVKNDGDEEKHVDEELGQIKEHGEQEMYGKAGQEEEIDVQPEELNNNEGTIERESSAGMAQQQENNLEFVEEAHEEQKDELKEKGWELDQETQVPHKGEVEENPGVDLIHQSSKKKQDTINELNGDEKTNFYDTVKEDIPQLAVKENIDIEASLEEQHVILSNDDQVSKNSDSLDEKEPNLKHTEQNVYDVNHSLFHLSAATELYEQTADSDVKEEYIDKLVHIRMSSHDVDPNIDESKINEHLSDTDSSTGDYKREEETEVAASQTVLNEPTTSSDNNDEIQSETEEAFGLWANNALNLFTTTTTTTTVNSEATGDVTTDESQVSVKVEEDIKLINDSIDHSPTNLFSTQSTVEQGKTRSRAITLNPKIQHKLYSNIFTYMNADDLVILVHSFGEHKLQFLDYILGSLDTVTGEHDADLSILLDIERLLSYQMKTLLTPSIRSETAAQEDTDKTRTLIALQKLEIVLEKVKEAFKMNKTETDNNEQDKDKEINNEIMEEIRGIGDEDERHDMEGETNQILDTFLKIATDALTQIHATLELLAWFTQQVVSALPEDIRPGPDLYGVPWEPIIISGLVGLVTVLIFICRCYSSVKSRMYRSKEQRMAEQVAQLLEEKCKVLETLSKVQQEYNGIEDSLRDSGVLAQTQKSIQLEAKAKQLEHTKREFKNDLEQLKGQLNQQREHRQEQEQRIMALEESIKTCEEETKMFQSQEEQAQTTLKVYSMNSDRLQRNLETAGEENALLQENNTHLHQQLEGWAERVSELEQEMRRREHSHCGMLQDVATKDERIMSLTDRLLQMKAWDPDLEEEQGADGETLNGTAGSKEANGRDITDPQGHLQKVQKLIHAAKLNADLKSVDEDKNRIFAKLNDEVKAKEDLQGSIKDLESEKLSLQSDAKHYTDQVQLLQQKLHIMTEMYQENELKLHRLLTVEEKERLQKEEKLTKADQNIAMAMEELNNYRQRAEEMEEELDKTKQSYQTQISSHEKKAHNNWLAARSAERELADIRRENALLRQKLTDTQFKLETLEKDPYALDSLARPLPFRAERPRYGPSPLGRPGSETRPFLSPPTLMDGPPNRLSPRVMRGPLEPPLGPGDTERPGGSHSDSGSISPTWDPRAPPPGPMSGPLPGPPGPMAPPGYIFPETGGPMYRRPPPGPMGLHPGPGPLPPRGNRPPGPPTDMAEGPYRENRFRPGEHDLKESVPGERRTPEADLRMGGMPPPGPMMGPMDGPFPRRGPCGPPPPEYYLPRGPGGAPMPMWLPPPGMMYPPRFPPAGPPPPHIVPYSGPTIRPPGPDGHPPPSIAPNQPPPPALTQSQSSEGHTQSPQDII